MDDKMWNGSNVVKVSCECRECNNDTFVVHIRFGSGDSGTYFRFKCSKCLKAHYVDIDNQHYDG